MAEPVLYQIRRWVRYQNKGTQSSTGMLRYQFEMPGAGMPMPAASALMPMPNHGSFTLTKP